MNRKAVIGTLVGLALVAGGAGTTYARGLGADASLKADASASHGDSQVEGGGEAHAGFRASLGRIFSFGRHDKGDDQRDSEERNHKALVGTAEVTAISGATITAEGRDGVTWTIVTNGDTKFVLRGDKESVLADIAVGDMIGFTGSVSGSDSHTVAAKLVSDWVRKADKDGHARAAGTISSVNAASSTFVLSTKHRGDVTVAVDASTTIRDQGSDSDGVFADLVVGAKVYVKGFFDSVARVMTATKVRIMENS